jgi:hypothetical protein
VTIYERLVVPYLVHLSMRQQRLEPYRRRVVPAAKGRVLEIGVGLGTQFSVLPSRHEVNRRDRPFAKAIDHGAGSNRERERTGRVD